MLTARAAININGLPRRGTASAVHLLPRDDGKMPDEEDDRAMTSTAHETNTTRGSKSIRAAHKQTKVAMHHHEVIVSNHLNGMSTYKISHIRNRISKSITIRQLERYQALVTTNDRERRPEVDRNKHS